MRKSHFHSALVPRFKSRPGLTRLLATALVLGLTALVSVAAPLGTAFTYSGRVKYQGNPANGSFDLQFELWDDPVNGAKHGQTLTVSGLGIVNGLFVTSLDFGGGLFDGTAYWLKISIRPSGNGNYTTLSPRQPQGAKPKADVIAYILAHIKERSR